MLDIFLHTLATEWKLSYDTSQCIEILYTFDITPGHVTLWCLQVLPVVYASDVISKKNKSKLT